MNIENDKNPAVAPSDLTDVLCVNYQRRCEL